MSEFDTAYRALEVAGLLLLLVGCCAVAYSFRVAEEADKLNEGHVTPKEPWR